MFGTPLAFAEFLHRGEGIFEVAMRMDVYDVVKHHVALDNFAWGYHMAYR